MIKLNLGCGTDIREGYLNIDNIKTKGTYHFDLNEDDWFFADDNSVDEILAFNILEHLNHPDRKMREMVRICKDGAIIKIKTSHFSSPSTWWDIQHVRPFSCKSFENIEGIKIKKMHLDFLHGKQIIGFFINKIKLLRKIWEHHFAYIFNSGDLYIEMEVIKR